MVFHPGGSQYGNPVYYRHHFPPLPQVRALSVHDEPEVSLRRTSEGSNEYESDYGSSSPYDPVNEGGYSEDIRRLFRKQHRVTKSQHYDRMEQQQLSQHPNLHLGYPSSPGMNSNEFNNYDTDSDDDIAELLRFNSEDFTDCDSDDDSEWDQREHLGEDSYQRHMQRLLWYHPIQKEYRNRLQHPHCLPSFRLNRHPSDVPPFEV